MITDFIVLESNVSFGGLFGARNPDLEIQVSQAIGWWAHGVVSGLRKYETLLASLELAPRRSPSARGIPAAGDSHILRGTPITAYLLNGGRLGPVQVIATYARLDER
ncbi:MAG: hypothetical protein JOZ29_14725 [Deltaproteobacteria bacterium]|nr:hypothetical protein [Deltaproteobacteria bacterium]